MSSSLIQAAELMLMVLRQLNNLLLCCQNCKASTQYWQHYLTGISEACDLAT